MSRFAVQNGRQWVLTVDEHDVLASKLSPRIKLEPQGPDTDPDLSPIPAGTG